MRCGEATPRFFSRDATPFLALRAYHLGPPQVQPRAQGNSPPPRAHHWGVRHTGLMESPMESSVGDDGGTAPQDEDVHSPQCTMPRAVARDAMRSAGTSAGLTTSETEVARSQSSRSSARHTRWRPARAVLDAAEDAAFSDDAADALGDAHERVEDCQDESRTACSSRRVAPRLEVRAAPLQHTHLHILSMARSAHVACSLSGALLHSETKGSSAGDGATMLWPGTSCPSSRSEVRCVACLHRWCVRHQVAGPMRSR